MESKIIFTWVESSFKKVITKDHEKNFVAATARYFLVKLRAAALRQRFWYAKKSRVPIFSGPRWYVIIKVKIFCKCKNLRKIWAKISIKMCKNLAPHIIGSFT